MKLSYSIFIENLVFDSVLIEESFNFFFPSVTFALMISLQEI